MKKIVLVLCLLGILFLSGCVLEYREGLPAKIVITEIPEPVPESIECQNPPCATLVQMSNIRRTEFVCSPGYKPANNDPQGVVYNQHFGDKCEPLPHPTTVCLRYDCDFDREHNIGFYEINCRYSHYGEAGLDGIPTTLYNNSLGVIQSGWGKVIPGYDSVCSFYSSLMSSSPKELDLITSGYNYFSNYYESYPEPSKVGIFFNNKWRTQPAQLTFVAEKSCPANMPIIYPYNIINFAYNPIINKSDADNLPTDFVRNLEVDYIYLKNQANEYIEDAETVDKESDDPCYDICSDVGGSVLESGDENKQFEEECNICQEERRKSLKESKKEEVSQNENRITSYSYYDLNPKAEGGPVCTGMYPCVEIDRTEYVYSDDSYDDSYETRYHICQCSCEVTIYAGWVCSRSTGKTDFYYTSCERNDILSDQGGYIFSVHGFEAELFMNILGRVDNKMPMFMLGQGSSFEDYFDAKRDCKPEITADEIIVAGDKPFNPGEIEIIEGSPLCFINEGIYSRNISINTMGNNLTFLEPNQGMCFDTGENTEFPVGIHTIYVNDNFVYATVKIIAPENLDDVINIIRNNENEELKFFFNNNIELSLLYASAPLEKTFIHNIKEGTEIQHHEYKSIGTGEFPIYSSLSVDENEGPLTWIAYETGYDSMEVIKHINPYKEKFDLWKDGYIDINDYIFATLLVAKDENNLVLFNELLNEYEYFEQINAFAEGSNIEKIDYPIIKKDASYLEFNPGAIILPVNSEFCVNNSMNERIDLILEKKFNPEYSRAIDEVAIFDEHAGMKIISMIYSERNLPNVLLQYTFGLPYYIYFNSIGKTNTHYSFVQSQSIAQGLQCCFHLGEPGIYRVSGLRGETGTGYVVVLPTDVSNTIVLRDYEYEPSYLIPNEGDFVCIKNPYDFERKVELSGSISDLITIDPSTEYCSYNWASKKDDEIFFNDKTTGGFFEMKVTNASILNIEIMGEMFLQTNGKISDSGTICFINKDNKEVKVSSNKLNGKKEEEIKIDSESIKCFSASHFGNGLYHVEILREEEGLFELTGGNYYIIIAEENEGYIYEGEMYGSPLNIRLEEFDFVSQVFQEREEREIKIHNLDEIEYILYSKITIDDISGLLTSSYYIQTPDIFFENNGDVDVKVTILNYNLPDEEVEVDANSGTRYTVRKGDYQIKLSSNEPEEELNKLSSKLEEYGGTFRFKALLNLNRMILREGSDYYADGPKTFNVEGKYPSIKFKNRLKLDIGTSNSQMIYFGVDDVHKENCEIIDSFVIDPIISRKSEIELQRLSGMVNNLDFAVQVLNDVPTSRMLYLAKSMLAYDKALPVFMYSRIGNVEVGIDNPFKSELHEIPRGSNVSYVKSDWLLSNSDYTVSYSPSTASILYGKDKLNELKEDLTFTIEAPSGAKKNVFVRAIDNPKTILMDYTEFEIDGGTGTGDKQYFVNNLAYEPRAFNFRPGEDLVDELCIEFKGVSNEDFEIEKESLEGSASNMILYYLDSSGPDGWGDIRYHSEIYSDKLASPITEIFILPNHGIEDAKIKLSRVESSEKEVGYLIVEPEYDESKTDFDLSFIEGHISGLKETYYVRAYRFYGGSGNQIKIGVDSEVFNPKEFNSDGYGEYSVLARAFTDKSLTGTSHINNLLKVSNLYLRMKDAKAIPNKWYMAGLQPTTFQELIYGFDTYLKEKGVSLGSKMSADEVTKPRWIPSGCGDYLFVVPFSKTKIFHAFAYDVPVTGSSYNNKANYSYTQEVRYPYALQRIGEETSFIIYNGEIINDVRFLMSENPNQATEICSYYKPEDLVESGDFGESYGENDWEGLEYYNPCIGEDKKDFELKIKSPKDNIFNQMKASYKGDYGYAMVYTPVGSMCMWGGGDALYTKSRCDGTNKDDCRGTYGRCTVSKDRDEEVTCTDGVFFDSMDSPSTSNVWWCRSNIDAFGHETGMLDVGSGDAWWILHPIKLNTSITIKNTFDTGISSNDNLYHFMSDGYFDFASMDKRTYESCGKNNEYIDDLTNICLDRGCSDSILNDFYKKPLSNHYKNSGLEESGLTFGLFFMINSVDTGDYFFEDELIPYSFVERSMGYVLSRDFTVENNKGRKLLCVGADTFDGKDIVLGPGEKDSFILDLKTEYDIYEPAFFTNLRISSERTFMYPSLFSRSDLEKYKISSFNYDKPMSNNYITTFPNYESEVNIYLYNLTVKLDYFDNSIDFEVVNLFEGESLILKNVGEEPIEWFYGVDDICSEDSFSNILQTRHLVSCSEKAGSYKDCLDNPTKYSTNPSDISEYLKSEDNILSVEIKPGEEVTLAIEDLKVIDDGSSTEYLFYHPQSGRRFNVIVSRDTYIVDLDVNTFNQDSVNILDNDNSKLCFRNYHSNPIDILVGGETHSISSYSKDCIDYDKLSSEIKDSTLERELEVNLDGFTPDDNKNVISVLKQITKTVTESTRASYHPALNFFELNVGASATPSIITTEIIDYRAINNYYDGGSYVEGTSIKISNPNHIPDLVDSVAEQVYTIVSNSRITSHEICGDGENMKEINKNNLCIDKFGEEIDFEDKDSTVQSMINVDCNDDDIFETDEEKAECELTKQKAKEALDELDFLTVINEEQVLTTLPILIQFEGAKTELSEQDVENMKNFIDEVNEKVAERCYEEKDCDNKLEINENCGAGDYENYIVKNRYLDLIGFVVLIDDPGPSYSGNCSLMFNYLDGIMDVSINAAIHDLEKGKMGTPSMILGLGINRESNPSDSCWSDLEFKREIESLFTTDFMIMLDSGIIGVGHYCLRDGECSPISTGIQGDDYGLYMTNEPDGWSSFKPIVIGSFEAIDIPTFNNLNQEEKDECILVGGLPYCLDLSTTKSGLFEINTGTSLLLTSSGLTLGTSGLTPGVLDLVGSSSTGFGFGISAGGYGASLGGLQGTPSKINFEFIGDRINIVEYPFLLSNGIKKEPLGREWFNRCGRYYYEGEGATMVTYPEMEVPKGQQGAACNPGRIMELYKQFNC